MSHLLSTWRDWRQRRKILQQLARIQADDSERLRFMVKDELTYALGAVQRGDLRYAIEVWTKLLDRHSADARASPLALPLLIGLRRFEEAEALMRQGQKAHPRDPLYAKGLADIAQAKGDHEDAIQHYAVLRKRFPGIIEGYVCGAVSLLATNRLDEAEALAERAIKLFPNDIRGYLEHARVAVRRANWAEALTRWKRVQDRFSHQFGYFGYAQALVRLGRHEEADKELAAARTRFPTDPDPVVERARLSEATGDVAQAMIHWRQLVQRFPTHLAGYADAAEALDRLGEPAEAAAILHDAIERFPGEQRPTVELAKLLHRRQDFAAAADAWARVRQADPHNEQAIMLERDCLRLTQSEGVNHAIKQETRP